MHADSSRFVRACSTILFEVEIRIHRLSTREFGPGALDLIIPMMSVPTPPTREPSGEPDRENSGRKENFWAQAARYSQLAFIFPAALVAGWLVGLALDHWLHTTWLYLAGILLGIAAGFIELIRTVLRETN